MRTEERDCAADCIRACSLPLRRRAVFGPPAVFISPHGPRYGRATDKITRYGLLTDTTWTAYRLLTDVLRTDYGLGHGRHTVSYSRAAHGHTTDKLRSYHGHGTGLSRTLYGPRAFAGRLSSGRVCVRLLFVLRSFVVRSRPVWRSSCVGSCGVRARRQIARRLTDAQRASDGRHTSLPTDF